MCFVWIINYWHSKLVKTSHFWEFVIQKLGNRVPGPRKIAKNRECSRHRLISKSCRSEASSHILHLSVVQRVVTMIYVVLVTTRKIFFGTPKPLPVNEDTSLIRLRKRSCAKVVCWPVLYKLDSKIMSNSVISVISRFLEEYTTTTPNKLKVVDAYLLYILLTGALQFLYCLLVGTFPFNSFLSGFISCVGAFILAGKNFFGLML